MWYTIHVTYLCGVPLLRRRRQFYFSLTYSTWWTFSAHKLGLIARYLVQGDSLARGPKLVYLQIFEFVNQLTDDELTNGYYQQDGATCYTSNASMREIESFFKDRIITKNLWPPRSPDLTPADFFLWGLLKGKVYKNTPRTIKQLKDAIRQEIQTVNAEKYSRIWRNAFKCAWMWKEISFSIDYEQVLFFIFPGMCI